VPITLLLSSSLAFAARRASRKVTSRASLHDGVANGELAASHPRWGAQSSALAQKAFRGLRSSVMPRNGQCFRSALPDQVLAVLASPLHDWPFCAALQLKLAQP